MISDPDLKSSQLQIPFSEPHLFSKYIPRKIHTEKVYLTSKTPTYFGVFLNFIAYPKE